MAKKITYNKIDENLYEIPEDFEKGMNVPARFYASRNTLGIITNDNSLNQLINVAKLPGIIKYALAMPDIHQGYGFPIGGVAAFDYDGGLISPGGVGYDINCGVRLLKSNLQKEEVQNHIKDLTSMIYYSCPTGTGKGACVNVSEKELRKILQNGAGWAVKNNYGDSRDLDYIEDNGQLTADDSYVSKRAIERGKYQVGSLGSGNHFLEIGYVESIYNRKLAQIYGVRENDVVVQIHCGSRGFGHQVCTDYLKKLSSYINKNNINLPDRQLVYASIHSEEGKGYFNAMNAAANYAFNNRQVLTHYVRRSFEKSLKVLKKPVHLDLIYDITHNIAKIESHTINGKKKKLIVHRKGATRAFGPNHEAIPDKYKNSGQPILVPGSMGTYSYLLAGTEKAMQDTFGSSCHGAGRTMSRTQARKSFGANKLILQLSKKDIHLQAKSKKGVSEEAPGAYKNVNDVVNILNSSGLVEKVARLRPMAVIKG
ncbi:MAG: RtcB family protein [Candidatus Mcinerneyibacterium aminivorans]|uniref:tRNA-splicing ligase RtcB n=1 Tax=Candidatus Mcinerneyibacterium aminivorans TaxID=2703815 RepID=A0A5D0MKG5_9BACT|nr:MAG: RtcB family protein [Candidatus Mcinerneyibacterium aminivorans]